MKFLTKFSLVMALLAVILYSSCKKDPPLSSDAEITSFSFNNPPAAGVITGRQIEVGVPFGTDVTNLAPVITISDKAAISPASGLPRNFTNPVNYVVTAEDGVTDAVYTVVVRILDPTTVVISGFAVPGAQSVNINQTNKTITINMLDGSDVTALTPTITTIPAGVTISPASGTAQDFTNPITYTLTQGATTASYVASVNFVAYGLKFADATIRYDGCVASSTLPDELASTGDNERGFSMNSAHMYVADKGDNQIYWYKNDGSSVEAGRLNKNGANGSPLVAGGIFALSDVVATEQGIVASNMAWAGGDFRVYRWANNDAPAELMLSFPASVDGSNVRLGDAINFVGDPFGNGKLYVMPFPGNNSITNNNYVLVWFVTGGMVTNAANPEKITFNGMLRAGNYGYVEPVSDGSNNYLLVNGAELVPSLWSIDGQTRLTDIPTNAINVRNQSGKIFSFNNARYLAIALPGSEGSTTRDAGMAIYDITGGGLVEAMNAIVAENAADKLVFRSVIGQQVNGNTGADLSVYVNTNRVFVMAGAINNGFRIVSIPINQ